MENNSGAITVHLNAVSKKYLEKPIFENISFTWQGTGIYSLIGENGSGKSTLLSLIAGLLERDAGKILINDQECRLDNQEYKKLVAYAPDESPIYGFIQGQEFLDLICSIRKLQANCYQNYIQKFRLESFLNTTFAEMSFGTAKKFLLISVLMTDAKVLLLDEPNNGLDQVSLNAFRDILIENSQNRLILMSCHDGRFRESVGANETSLEELKTK